MKKQRQQTKKSTVELPMSQFSAQFPVLSMMVEDIIQHRAGIPSSPTTPNQTQESKISAGVSQATVGQSVTAKARRQARQPSTPLRLQVLADLHLEFGQLSIPKPEADVVVLAGDVHAGAKGIEWINQHFADRPVIYVLGNHEYYRNSLPELTRSLKQKTEGSHIHLLENEAVELHGYTFLGCTLWSSFMVGPDPAAAMRTAESLMNDYRIIRNSTEDRVLRPADTAKLHRESVAWLKDELRRHDPKWTIVVTHHAPSYRSEAPFHSGSPLSPAFCSDLDGLIESSGVPLWIHGHTHYNVDYKLGSTRILSNQCGYPRKGEQGFNPPLVVELK